MTSDEVIKAIQAAQVSGPATCEDCGALLTSEEIQFSFFGWAGPVVDLCHACRKRRGGIYILDCNGWPLYTTPSA